MPLKLMYLTNDPDVAMIAESVSVDRIFLDLEILGKEKRQGHLDTVISHNSLDDVKKIKDVLKKAELLVRVNPINDNSETEITSVLKNGADIVMLPYFKSKDEVQRFISIVNGRAKVCLLCETPEAVNIIDDIISLSGIDEIHIGLNDLHLGYKMEFMFQLIADGTVDMLCEKFKEKDIAYGFGGVGRVGSTDVMLPAENIINEHYRLGSQMVILSRAFCDTSKITDKSHIRDVFNKGVSDFRKYEKEVSCLSAEELQKTHTVFCNKVNDIVATIRKNSIA